MPTDTKPADTGAATFAQQELKMIQLVLSARGWECVDVRQEGDWLRLAARRHFPPGQLDVTRLKD